MAKRQNNIVLQFTLGHVAILVTRGTRSGTLRRVLKIGDFFWGGSKKDKTFFGGIGSGPFFLGPCASGLLPLFPFPFTTA